MSKIIFLDAGHGGLDGNGHYTTQPNKMHVFPGQTFRLGRTTMVGEFYEGVFNRFMAVVLENALRRLGFVVIPVHHHYLDTPLKERVEEANHYDACTSEKTIYISLHANASPGHNARGFEIYTSPGETDSDRLAEDIYSQVDNLLGYVVRMRPDLRSDGDHDKEERFYVLQNTTMPAVLIEFGFFDQIDDALLLCDPIVQERFVDAICRGVFKFMNR